MPPDRWSTSASPSDITGSLGEKAEKTSGNPRRDLALHRERFKANPKDADAALKYGKALRATGQKSQAGAVLEQLPDAQREAYRHRARAGLPALMRDIEGLVARQMRYLVVEDGLVG